jgi:hypothetical protein
MEAMLWLAGSVLLVAVGLLAVYWLNRQRESETDRRRYERAQAILEETRLRLKLKRLMRDETEGAQDARLTHDLRSPPSARAGRPSL